MEKAFLSHSSSDKTLVRHIAGMLGMHHCAYDEYSFAPGMQTLEEIFREMDESDIFVIFISESALKSDWVKQELNEAWKRHSQENLERILPIIIDPNVDYHHKDIPGWLSEKYNIRLVQNEMVIYNIIRNALRFVNFKHHPLNLELERLFVGRNDEIAHFERDINNLEGWIPTYIVAYNFYEGIGRKRFLRHALGKENFIRRDTLPIHISLNGQQSIESFIMKLNAVTENEDVIKADLAQQDIGMKIRTSLNLIIEIIKNKEVIFIDDDGCIVLPTGQIVGWFRALVQNEEFKNRLVFCVISKYRPNESRLLIEHRSLVYNIPELKKSETQSLFLKLLNIYGLGNLSVDDRKFFLEHLRGIPQQIIYAINMIDRNLNDARKGVSQIDRFADQSSKVLFEKLRENPLACQMAILLSRHEVMSVTVLQKIFGDNEDSRIAIQMLHDLSVISYFFGGYEHVSLNSSLADFIKRSGVQLDTQYQKQNAAIIKKLLKQDLDKILARDYSEFMMTLQNMIQEGKRIPAKYFIPSLLLKDVITMYDQGKYDRVVDICEKLLLETRSYDEQILWQTRYWLTSALSKKKDRRALEHLKYFQNDKIAYYFLKGFYYRNIGEKGEAMECYEKVLKLDPRHKRSKREKVNILLSLEKYEDAYELAKENYEQDKSNIYHIQSYFITLVRRREYLKPDDIKVLDSLIEDMESRIDNKAKDMARCMVGEYAYYVKNDFNRARLTLMDAIDMNENKNYPRKSLWEIYKTERRTSEFSQLRLSGDVEAYDVDDFN